MFKDKPFEIKFNILRKDSQIQTQTTYTSFCEPNVIISPNLIRHEKGSWMITLGTYESMSLLMRNITLKCNKDDVDNNRYILQCNYKGKDNEGVRVNLQKDDVLIILPEYCRWNAFGKLSKAFAFVPYISGITTEQEFYKTVKTAFSDTDDIASFRFCVLNAKDKFHQIIELIDVAPFKNHNKC